MDQMTAKQWQKWHILKELKGGKLTQEQGARLLGRSSRQIRRMLRAYEKHGKKVLHHGNRGRAPFNRVCEQMRKEVLRLARTKYAGFNDQHLTEKLVSVEGLSLSVATMRRILRGAQSASPKTRRSKQHRRRRERRAREGMMILWDGSDHDWLEGRGQRLTLMAAMDDATGKVLAGAHFVLEECSVGYLRILDAIVRTHGIALSLYCDRHSSLKRNDEHWTKEEKLRGKQNPTQVQRALEELGIEIIYALSPQAKGRVERLWGTMQDRLVSELRLAKAETLEQAQAVLERFIPEHNAQFAIEPKESEPAWRRVPPGLDVQRVVSFYQQAVVRNDNTVRIAHRLFDIAPGRSRLSYAKAHVEVRRLLDDSWRIYYKDELIAQYPPTPVTSQPAQPIRKPSRSLPRSMPKRENKPKANHPWKKEFVTYTQKKKSTYPQSISLPPDPPRYDGCGRIHTSTQTGHFP